VQVEEFDFGKEEEESEEIWRFANTLNKKNFSSLGIIKDTDALLQSELKKNHKMKQINAEFNSF
jgi:hypothetical protein